MINRAPGLKLVVQTLLSSLRPIGNIVLICCTFFIIFGILGVQVSVFECKEEKPVNNTIDIDFITETQNVFGYQMSKPFSEKFLNIFQNVLKNSSTFVLKIDDRVGFSTQLFTSNTHVQYFTKWSKCG